MMTGGFAGTTTRVYAAGSALPTCTDPTGQNLPCMMLISTLPPPANALQCQESSGRILSCSYDTQNLSNGQEVVVITVYVPASFVFSPGVVKVVVHETEKTVINKVIQVHCPPFTFCPPPPEHHTADFLAGYSLGTQDGSVGVYDLAAACEGKTGAALEHCYIGYKDAYVTACHQSKFGCGDGPTTCPPGESAKDCSAPSQFPPLKINTGCEKLPGLSVSSSNCPLPQLQPPKQPNPACNAPVGGPPCSSPTLSGPQQSHTAAYLQALNSGLPNPYKPGTKDYEHYQAGLAARQENGAPPVAGPSTTKRCPDGSTIPAVDNCHAPSTPSNPSSPSNPSNPSGTTTTPSGGGTMSPPSGGSGNEGSSGGTSGSGSGSGSTGSSGNSGGGGGSGSGP